MNKILTLTALGYLLISSTSFAGLYGQLGVGASFNDGSITRDALETSYKNSPIYSGAVGYELPVPFISPRVEAEYLHISADAKHGEKAKFDGAFLNGYATIPFIPVVDPYVGAGIGMSRFDHNNTSAFQGMAGLDFSIPTLPITLSAEYRYLKVNEVGGKWDSPSKFHSNILMLKARYSF